MSESHANSREAAGGAPREDERAAAASVSVLLPVPLAEPLCYRVPRGVPIPAPGSFVRVPLGARRLSGVVWESRGEPWPIDRQKPLIEVLDGPSLPAELRRFIERTALYTLAPLGMVLRMAMSVPEALQPPRPRRLAALSAEGRVALAAKARLSVAQTRVLSYAGDLEPMTAAELARKAGAEAGVVRRLLARGFIEERLVPCESESFPPPVWRADGLTLSADQEAAARRLVAGVEEGGFRATLLDGVTGSGKTETYFAAVAAALAAGKQALVLLPEIALSAQWLERFRRRFGVAPAEWHSDIARTRRREVWRAVARGRARVVVGARSALFLPFRELGLIVVDEEHDLSYKQEDGVSYQARDMAVLRASLAKIPIVLASATPSLETAVNVARGRYERVALPRRLRAASLPQVRLVDLRREPCERGRFLSPPLLAAMKATLDAGEQTLLFLNRRGYAPLTLCRACGHRFECPNCTSWLVAHRFKGQLLCHHCGYSEPLPLFCPECLASDSLSACGPGVERVREEVALRFPEARIALMVSDLISGPRAAADLATAMTEGRYDVLIGTQIVAKGHHFPLLTLVGVVDADLGLQGGDLRAAERTYQLLHQVGGRAGRAERPGRVLIQTAVPEERVMQALESGDRDRFLEAEAEMRRAAGLPPFGRLAALILAATSPEAVDFAARALARAAPQLPGLTVLGPAPAPLAVLRGRHRRRFLAKASREVSLQAVVGDWLSRVRLESSVRIQVDIDPYHFL